MLIAQVENANSKNSKVEKFKWCLKRKE